MEPVSTILLTALGYILKGAAQSKTAETAKDEALGHFWSWIRPRFIKEVPEIEKKSDSPETEEKALKKLVELIQDKAFFEELLAHVAEFQKAGIKEKNILKKDLKRIKIIRIGDKEYSPDDSYQRKNIVEGKVEDVDEFILGDGH